MEVINSFSGLYRDFSNFTPVEIRFENMTFPSVEHAYVASKTTNLGIRRKIVLIPTAGQAKRFGRTIELRSDWDKVKISYMEDFLRQKFSKDYFKSFLLGTGDSIIIEGNGWHDNFWGDCSCENCKNIPGENMLGKLLMKIREDLKIDGTKSTGNW